MRMTNGLAQARLQLHAVHDDLLRMDGLNRVERHDEVPRILDVDYELRPAARCDLTYRSEYLATVGNIHLISYRDLFVHDVALPHSCSWTMSGLPRTVDRTCILMRCT